MEVDKVVVFGSSGQLGQTLRRKFNWSGPTSKELDITDSAKVTRFLEGTRPTVVINCAAFTNVDEAEIKTQSCYSTNLKSVKILSELAIDLNFYFIQISTDYVFDGVKGDYSETDHVNPINFYGLTKAWSEKFVPRGSLIIRTAHLFSDFKPNIISFFLKKITEGSQIQVVVDQVVSITYAEHLADFIHWCVNNRPDGIYHFVNEGSVTWLNVVQLIAELKGLDIKVSEISFQELGRIAARPLRSNLQVCRVNKIFNVKNWEIALKEYLCKNIPEKWT